MKENIYFADFETTSPKLHNEYAWVSLWGIQKKDKFVYGFNVSGFIQECLKDRYSTVYFHNLAFDGEFICDFLIKMKIPYDDELLKENCFCWDKTYQNVMYWIKLKIGSKIVFFKDSYKIMPFSVKKLGEYLNKPKGDVDYEIFNELHMTKDKSKFLNQHPQILLYLKRDIDIISEFYNHMSQVLGIGLTNTISSCALNNFFGNKYRGLFTNLFINKIDVMTWDYLKLGYFGGYILYKEEEKEKIINKKVYHYDINSYYPFIMESFELPYGELVKNVNVPAFRKYLFVIYRIIVFKAKLKPNCAPVLMERKAGLKIKYVREVNQQTVFCITQWEKDLVDETYDIDYMIEKEFYFKKQNLFKGYVKKWKTLKLKWDKNAVLRQICKLLQNSLYGKFGQKYIFNKKILDKDFKEKNILIQSKRIYPLHTAIAITGIARTFLVRVINKYYKYFHYCDTDSLMLSCKLPDSFLHDTLYGKFKLEKVYDQLKIVGKKCYIGKSQGKYYSAICGLPKDAQKILTFENFYTGSTFQNVKNMKQRALNGSFIIPADFTIKERL